MATLGYPVRWEPREGSRRTLLLLHGTGGDENDLIPLGDLLDPGANLIAPRGDVSEHGSLRFFRRLAEGVFDIPDLERAAAKLANFVSDAAEEYGFDPARMTAVGFSNGANVAAAAMLLHPGAITRAVLIRAMVPLIPPSKPDLAGTEVFLSSGRRDPLMSPSEAKKLETLFRGYGADVTSFEVDAGHQLTRADVDAARDWLRSRR